MKEMNEKEKLIFKQSLDELRKTLKLLREVGRHHYADEIEELIIENEKLMKTS